MSDLKGIISPFTTPFSKDGEINYSLVKPQVDWLIDNGVHGLAAGGSTGEGHVLDREEYIKLMKTTVDSVNGRIPVVAGIVTNSTSEVIARGKSVKDLKISALQITPPHYLFKPDDNAMVNHFKEIYDECNIPILIYNVVPWCYLSPDLLIRIMDEVPGVLGVKQSAAAPGPSVKLWNAIQNENFDVALDLHQKLMPLWDAIGLDNMPSLCKYAQKLQGLDAGYARKPTSSATKNQKKKVEISLKGLGLI